MSCDFFTFIKKILNKFFLIFNHSQTTITPTLLTTKEPTIRQVLIPYYITRQLIPPFVVCNSIERLSSFSQSKATPPQWKKTAALQSPDIPKA